MSKKINEIWKPIKGYEGLYEVSNLGRVRSVIRYYENCPFPWRKGRILKICGYEKGKAFVALSKNCTKSTKQVARLVAEAFLLDSSRRYETKDYFVLYKNNDSTDCRAENLEIVIRQ